MFLSSSGVAGADPCCEGSLIAAGGGTGGGSGGGGDITNNLKTKKLTFLDPVTGEDGPSIAWSGPSPQPDVVLMEGGQAFVAQAIAAGAIAVLTPGGAGANIIQTDPVDTTYITTPDFRVNKLVLKDENDEGVRLQKIPGQGLQTQALDSLDTNSFIHDVIVRPGTGYVGINMRAGGPANTAFSVGTDNCTMQTDNGSHNIISTTAAINLTGTEGAYLNNESATAPVQIQTRGEMIFNLTNEAVNALKINQVKDIPLIGVVERSMFIQPLIQVDPLAPTDCGLGTSDNLPISFYPGNNGTDWTTTPPVLRVRKDGIECLQQLTAAQGGAYLDLSAPGAAVRSLTPFKVLADNIGTLIVSNGADDQGTSMQTDGVGRFFIRPSGSNVTVAGNIFPEIDNSYSVGDATHRLNGIWATTGHIDDLATTDVYPRVDNKNSVGTAVQRYASIYATSGVVNTSDRRRKRQIKRLDGEFARRMVNKIDAKTFVFKDEPGPSAHKHKRTHIGFIAQDVAETLDEISDKKEDWALYCKDDKPDGTGDILSLRYDHFIPIHQTVLQDLLKRVSKVERRMEAVVADAAAAATTKKRKTTVVQHSGRNLTADEGTSKKSKQTSSKL